MKKVMVVATAGVIAGVILTALAVPATSQPQAERTTITVFDPQKTPYEKRINEGRKGFSPGDWSVSVEKFLDPDTCEPAGRAIIRFVFVKSVGDQDGDFIIDFTYLREDGKIVGYGGGRFSQFDDGFAITGGTKAYRDASGEITFEEPAERCDKKGALLTFDLLLS